MKLLRFVPPKSSVAKLGVVVDGTVMDLGPTLSQLTGRGDEGSATPPSDTPDFFRLGKDALRLAKSLDSNGGAEKGKRYNLNEVRILSPVARPGKMVALGFNYKSHADQASSKPPERPTGFLKLPSTIIGPDEPIVLPTQSKQVDFEGELAVVIGESAKNVDKQDALKHVAGYTIANDVSARDVQYDWQKQGGHFFFGKNFDTFSPLGPWLITSDSLDPSALDVTTKVNGEDRQNFNTKDMVFNIQETIDYISRYFVLEPGDVILTGTGPGSAAHTDQRYLKAGDEVEVTVAQIGALKNKVVA